MNDIEVAIDIIGGVARLVASVGDWLAIVTSGRSDAISERVRDTLPQESRSQAAARVGGFAPRRSKWWRKGAMTMPGVIVDGRAEAIPVLTCVSWHDDPALRLRMGEDGGPRPPGTWIRAIVLHTTQGIPGGKDTRPQKILPGVGPARGTARATNRWWSTDVRNAGAHVVVDFDGSVACLADLIREQTYHATTVNPHTVGIEIAQGQDAELWEGQLDAVVVLVEWLCRRLQIQPQMPDRYGGPLPRLQKGGHDVCGVYGHRDQTAARGRGDPGDAIFQRLAGRGFQSLDMSADADLVTWKQRQATLGVHPDGLPGPITCTALRDFQRAHALTESRIADAPTRLALDKLLATTGGAQAIGPSA